MAGKLPPRDLCVVIEDVLVLPSDFGAGWEWGAPARICSGIICQALYGRPSATSGGQAWTLIYYDGGYGSPILVKVPSSALRPYDSRRDAETKKLEGSGGAPQRCAP